MLNNVRAIYKDVCKNAQGQDEWINNIRCLQPTDLSVLHKYFNTLTVLGDFVVKNVKADDVVPWACCAWFTTFESVEASMHAMCDSRTGPATATYFMSLVRAVTSDAVDIACGKFSSRDLCNFHFKSGMKVLDSLPVPQLNYSVVVPLVGMIKLLDSKLTSDGEAAYA